MAKTRIEPTIPVELRDDVRRYADRYHQGNMSAAAEHLLRQGIQTEAAEVRRSMAYAGTGIAAMLCILSFLPL